MVVANTLESPPPSKPSLGYAHRLRRGAWFASLPETLQAEILSMVVERSYARRQMIATQGSRPEGLIAILAGQVTLSRWLTPSEEVVIHLAEPGSWLGECVLTDCDTAFSATAETPVDALVIPRLALSRLLAREPHWYPYFQRLLEERCSLFLEMAAESRGLSPEKRLRHRLASLAERASGPGQGGAELTLSQCNLASLLGLSRQTTNRLLQGLSEAGLIDLAFRKITVPDSAALRYEPEDR